MELATTLKGDPFYTVISGVWTHLDSCSRFRCSHTLKPDQVRAAEAWPRAIAVYPESEDHLHRLEDAQPDQELALHRVNIHGPHLTGPYGAHQNAVDRLQEVLHPGQPGRLYAILADLKITLFPTRPQYPVSYKGRLANFFGRSERADKGSPLPIAVHHRHSDLESAMQGLSSLKITHPPIKPTGSHWFALFFLQVQLLRWLLKRLHLVLSIMARCFRLGWFWAHNLVETTESETHPYLQNSRHRPVEIYPTIIELQQLIVRQDEQFMQQSSQSPDSSRNAAQSDLSHVFPEESAHSKPQTAV